MKNPKVNKNPAGNSKRNASGKKVSSYGTGLELGRVIVTPPRYGHLKVYSKSNNGRGAIFITERDGNRCGTTKGVLKQFIKIGCYDGWGYIDMDRAVIFKFIVGDASNTPRSLIAIKVSDGRVNFPPSIKNTAEYTDGAIVAFYARFAKRNGTERQKRVATDIFLLDDKHLPLIARLINADRLSFPQHNDVLEFFLDALTSVQVLDHRDVDLFSSALTNLALDSRVPTQLKTLARVERSKLDPTDAVGANVPCEQPLTNAKTHKSMKQKSMVKSRQNGIVVDDVIQVGLKIERE